MNGFQLLGVGLALGFALLIMLSAMRGRMARLTASAWLVVWLAAAGAIAWPRVTVVVARWLGIERGADLVFYCAILAMLAGFFVVYLRLRRLDEAMTRLVRHLAIAEATPPTGSPDAADGAGHQSPAERTGEERG